MVFHEYRLLGDDANEISNLIFSKIGKDVQKFVLCCSHDWHFKVKISTYGYTWASTYAICEFMILQILAKVRNRVGLRANI